MHGPATVRSTQPEVATECLRVLVHPPARGAWNMAVDEALMDSARSGRVTLRLYAWKPGCLSFGRNQRARGRYDGEAARRRGLDIVRRPTGGRSVLHDRELTYAVTAPAGRWGTLLDSYMAINRSLASGLHRLGVTAEVTPDRSRSVAPRPTARACFRDPLPGEVRVAGRKLIGSAQWRERGALLQHGSILLHNDQAVVEELRVGGPPASEVPAIGLAEVLDSIPAPWELAGVFGAALGAGSSLTVQSGELTPEERGAADALMPRYEDDAWTWRR